MVGVNAEPNQDVLEESNRLAAVREIANRAVILWLRVDLIALLPLALEGVL
jgi:hypothetical protein